MDKNYIKSNYHIIGTSGLSYIKTIFSIVNLSYGDIVVCKENNSIYVLESGGLEFFGPSDSQVHQAIRFLLFTKILKPIKENKTKSLKSIFNNDDFKFEVISTQETWEDNFINYLNNIVSLEEESNNVFHKSIIKMISSILLTFLDFRENGNVFLDSGISKKNIKYFLFEDLFSKNKEKLSQISMRLLMFEKDNVIPTLIEEEIEKEISILISSKNNSNKSVEKITIDTRLNIWKEHYRNLWKNEILKDKTSNDLINELSLFENCHILENAEYTSRILDARDHGYIEEEWRLFNLLIDKDNNLQLDRNIHHYWDKGYIELDEEGCFFISNKYKKTETIKKDFDIIMQKTSCIQRSKLNERKIFLIKIRLKDKKHYNY